MRACFLGRNICSLGYGVAILQVPRLEMDEPVRDISEGEKHVGPIPDAVITKALIGSRPVVNSQRTDGRPDGGTDVRSAV